MFAIQRNDGKYVTKSGCAKSYTSRFDEVAVFSTRERAAEYGICGNEEIVKLKADNHK